MNKKDQRKSARSAGEKEENSFPAVRRGETQMRAENHIKNCKKTQKRK